MKYLRLSGNALLLPATAIQASDIVIKERKDSDKAGDIWMSYREGMQILQYIHLNSLWWLHNGITMKYLDIRFDSRTGNMRIFEDDRD